VLRTALSFALRLLAALVLLAVIMGLQHDVGPFEAAVLLAATAALVAASLRVGRSAAR
jgi:hypothetical protein